MADKHHRQAKLIADTFHEDWDGGPTAAFARAAAASVRRRRAVKRTMAAVGAAAAIIVAAVVGSQHAVQRATVADSPRPAPASRGYEIISDDELLTQVHDRPLLLVQNGNGSRRIVVLEN